MSADLLRMAEPEVVPVSPPQPAASMDSDFLGGCGDTSVESQVSHGTRTNFLGMGHDGSSGIKLPPLGPRRSHSPIQDGQMEARKPQRYHHLKGRHKPLLRTSMASSMRTNTPDDHSPECVPFQPQNFMSSTKLKKVHISKRHLDTFGGTEYSIPSKRGIILHSDRYSWEGARPLEGSISQRDRMRLEIDYIEKLRGLKKRKEVWPHRAEMDLLMAGKRIEFEERFDLNGELQCLKSLILPDAAKDLFHGKGIRLPGSHASLKPRPNRAYLEMYGDGDVSASAPSALRTLVPGRFGTDPDIRRGWPNTQAPNGRGVLPSINKHNSLRIGIGPLSETTVPVTLSQARRATKGRKPSQPPGSILPQSKPSPLPRLELHPSRSYNTTSGADSLTANEQPVSPVAKNLSPSPGPGGDDDNSHQLDQPDTEREATYLSLPPITSPVPPLASEEETKSENQGENEEESRIPVPHTSEETEEGVVPAESGEITGEKTPLNPLQGADLEQLVSEGEKTQLTETFQRLDTDNDGHLQYDQLMGQLPVPSHQELYLRQVYDISSSQTFFGVDEFITMNALANTVRELSGPAAEAFNTLEQVSLGSSIVKHVELFQSVDRMRKGYISLTSLKEILSTTTEKDLSAEEQQWSEILQVLNKDEDGRLSKVEFLSLIPYFLMLAPEV